MKQVLFKFVILLSFCISFAFGVETAEQITPSLKLKAHGGVLQLNGTSAYIPIKTLDKLSNISKFTIETWINFNENTQENQYIFQQTLNDTNKIEIYYTPQGVLSITINDASILYDINLSYNTWHHIAIVYNGTQELNRVVLYLDGDSMNPNNTMGVFPTQTSDLNETNSSLSSPMYNKSFLMDEFRIWNIDKNQTAILENMNLQLDTSDPDLIAYYNFDERVGRTIYDISLNSYDGELQGDILRLNFLSEHINFDGENSYIKVADSDILDTTSALSLSAWVKPNNFHKGAIFSKYYNDDELGEHGSYELLLNENGTISFYLTIDGNTTGITTTQTYQINQWQYISATYDNNTQVAYIYLDGEPIASQSLSGLVDNSEANLYIGKRSFVADSYHFYGSISESAIWSKALSQSEIQGYMYNALSGMEANLIGYWPLDEGSLQTIKVYDRTLNQNDGNLFDTTWETSVPTILGDTLYTTQNSVTKNPVIVKNYGGILYNDMLYGSFIYQPTISQNHSILVSTKSLELSMTVQVIVYPEPMDIFLELKNLNLTTNNITAITLIGADGIDNNYTFDISNIIDGNNTLTTQIEEYGTYMLAITLQDNTTWYFNTADGMLYDTIQDTNQFLGSLSSMMNTIYLDFKYSKKIYSNISLDVFGTTWTNLQSDEAYIGNTIIKDENFLTMQVAKKTNTISIATIDKNDSSVQEFSSTVDIVTLGENSSIEFLMENETYAIVTKIYQDRVIVDMIQNNNIITSKEIYNTQYDDITLFNTKLNINMWVSIDTIFCNITDTQQNQLGTLFQYKIDKNHNQFNHIAIAGIMDDKTAQAPDSLEVNILSTYGNNKLNPFYLKPTHIVQTPLSQEEYNTIQTLPFNDILYSVYTTQDINGYQQLNINQVFFEDNLSYQSMSIIDTKSQVVADIKNIDNNSSVTMKLHSTISSIDSLNQLFSNMDYNVTFTQGAQAYKIFTKQNFTQCNTIGRVSLEEFSSFDEIITKYSSEYIARNNYDPMNRVIYLATNKDILESNQTTQTKIGTWEELDAISCQIGPDTIVFDTVIQLNTDTIGYENIAFGYKNNILYALDYRPNNSLKQQYYLNSEAARQLALSYGLNTPIIIEKNLTKEWTYIALPTNMTICLQEYQDLSGCNKDFTIESIFQNKIDAVFKYSGDWSYWNDNNISYNIDRLSSIDGYEGLLIKSTTPSVLKVPYDPFSQYTNSLLPMYKKGWFLVKTPFTHTTSGITNVTKKQNKTLKYILKFNQDDNWEVYAPNNDSQIDATLPRLEGISNGEVFWINVE
jgi:hypothetical protein